MAKTDGRWEELGKGTACTGGMIHVVICECCGFGFFGFGWGWLLERDEIKKEGRGANEGKKADGRNEAEGK